MLKFSLLAVTLVLVTLRCSTVSVTSDYDLDADFSKYKTFYINTGELLGSKLESVPLVKKRVLDAIESELLKKGFTKQDSTEADMTVFAQANTAEKMNINSYGYSYGYGWGPYPYGRNIDISYYTQGSLIIDFVDNKKNELIWRGIGTAVIQNRGTPEEREQFINDAIAKILDQYPPTK